MKMPNSKHVHVLVFANVHVRSLMCIVRHERSKAIRRPAAPSLALALALAVALAREA
jgi:hypothetical protein